MQPSDRAKREAESQRVMRKIGMQLITEKKAAILEELSGGKAKCASKWGGRDLLLLLLKANISPDIPPSQRLSDDNVLSRKLHRIPARLNADDDLHPEVPTYIHLSLYRTFEAF